MKEPYRKETDELEALDLPEAELEALALLEAKLERRLWSDEATLYRRTKKEGRQSRPQ